MSLLIINIKELFNIEEKPAAKVCGKDMADTVSVRDVRGLTLIVEPVSRHPKDSEAATPSLR